MNATYFTEASVDDVVGVVFKLRMASRSSLLDKNAFAFHVTADSTSN